MIRSIKTVIYWISRISAVLRYKEMTLKTGYSINKLKRIIEEKLWENAFVNSPLR